MRILVHIRSFLLQSDNARMLQTLSNDRFSLSVPELEKYDRH